MIKSIFTLLFLTTIGLTNKVDHTKKMNNQTNSNSKITLGAGCFWCVEAVFEEVKGIKRVTSGYMGGKVKNPTYREVCSGLTGHAEVVQLEYDPKQINLSSILEIFWKTHDPTTLNRQGNDIGTQYRSAIFYHSDDQKNVATALLNKLNSSGAYSGRIITEISKASEFYVAEDYHQDYFSLNSQQPYCQYVIQPKLDKFRKVFVDYLKESN